MSASPWVTRNLDGAQYTQPRGSQYEGQQLEWDLEDRFVFDREVTQFVRSMYCSRYCMPKLGHTPACDSRELAAWTEAEHRLAYGDR